MSATPLSLYAQGYFCSQKIFELSENLEEHDLFQLFEILKNVLRQFNFFFYEQCDFSAQGSCFPAVAQTEMLLHYLFYYYFIFFKKTGCLA